MNVQTISIDEITLEIADAAIDFVESRLAADAAKDERANLLRSEECSGQDDIDCYRSTWPFHAYCVRCQRASLAHKRYRKAVARRTSALIRLRRLVTKRNIKAAA